MLVITHVRFNDTAAFYENIRAVTCDAVTTMVPRVLSVGQLIIEMKNGLEVYSQGTPPGRVEVFEVYDREFIRSAAGSTTSNDLLSLPHF